MPINTKNQFSIRSLLLLPAIVSLFLAVRASYLLGHELPEAIRRAHHLPPLFAMLAVVSCVFRRSITGLRGLFLVGLCTSLVVAVTLTVEIAESLRRGYGYWNWWSDLPTFFEVVGAHAAIGGAIGLGSAVLLRIVRKRSPPDNAIRPTGLSSTN